MSNLLEIAKFIKNTSLLIKEIVDSTHQSTSNSLQVVTSELTKIQAETDKQAHQATDKLDHLYFEPNATESQELSHVQHEVDDIIESTLANESLNDVKEISQLGSEFSKTVEAVAILNDHFTKTLFQLMGTLSTEDVIHLRLNNLSKCCDHIVDLVNHCQCQHTQSELFKEFSAVHDDVQHLFSSIEETNILSQSKFKAPATDPIKSEDVIAFFGEFLNVLSNLTEEVRKIFISAIEDTNDSVFQMANIATESIKHAQYKVRRDGDTFKNVVVESEDEPLNAIKEVSTVVSDGIFSLMHVLSEGDVSSQRLEVASKIAIESAKCLKHINIDFNLDVQLKTTAAIYYGFFVSEDDKQLFYKYFDLDQGFLTKQAS